MHLNPETLILSRGAHSPDSGQACVMELCACLAGEDWSDTPKCVSPVIAAFMRSWNDGLPDDERQMLKELVPVVMNTATGAADDVARSWMAQDWMIRVHTPAWLELAGLRSHADGLRGLGEIRDHESLAAAMGQIVAAQSASAAAWDAARDAAWDAARAAARDAAWDAARAAAWDAARAAAWDAARDAAWDAARAAARDALKPTVASLQRSALDLVRRMSQVGRQEKP